MSELDYSRVKIILPSEKIKKWYKDRISTRTAIGAILLVAAWFVFACLFLFANYSNVTLGLGIAFVCVFIIEASVSCLFWAVHSHDTVTNSNECLFDSELSEIFTDNKVLKIKVNNIPCGSNSTADLAVVYGDSNDYVAEKRYKFTVLQSLKDETTTVNFTDKTITIPYKRAKRTMVFFPVFDVVEL